MIINLTNLRESENSGSKIPEPNVWVSEQAYHIKRELKSKE